MPIIKKRATTNTHKDDVERNSYILFQGRQIGPVTVEINMALPHKNKNRIVI